MIVSFVVAYRWLGSRVDNKVFFSILHTPFFSCGYELYFFSRISASSPFSCAKSSAFLDDTSSSSRTLDRDLQHGLSGRVHPACPAELPHLTQNSSSRQPRQGVSAINFSVPSGSVSTILGTSRALAALSHSTGLTQLVNINAKNVHSSMHSRPTASSMCDPSVVSSTSSTSNPKASLSKLSLTSGVSTNVKSLLSTAIQLRSQRTVTFLTPASATKVQATTTLSDSPCLPRNVSASDKEKLSTNSSQNLFSSNPKTLLVASQTLPSAWQESASNALDSSAEFRDPIYQDAKRKWDTTLSAMATFLKHESLMALANLSAKLPLRELEALTERFNQFLNSQSQNLNVNSGQHISRFKDSNRSENHQTSIASDVNLELHRSDVTLGINPGSLRQSCEQSAEVTIDLSD